MTRWWEGPLAPFDLESTGTNTRGDRIVSWCTGLTRLDQERPHIESEIVNPGVPIPPGAIEVHGITDEHARSFGNPPDESLARLTAWLAEMVKALIPIVPFNGAYDFALLHWECIRHGVPTLLDCTGGVIIPVVDTYVLDKRVDPYRKGKRKLADHEGQPGVASVYGIRLDDAHNAVADALAAVDAARVIGSRYPMVGDLGPIYLHALQVEWRAQQQASLQRHFRGKGGKPDAYVDPCWPICLDLDHPTT